MRCGSERPQRLTPSPAAHKSRARCPAARSPLQFWDNGGAVYAEVALWVLNQSGRTIGAGQAAQFKIGVSTLATL